MWPESHSYSVSSVKHLLDFGLLFFLKHGGNTFGKIHSTDLSIIFTGKLSFSHHKHLSLSLSLSLSTCQPPSLSVSFSTTHFSISPPLFSLPTCILPAYLSICLSVSLSVCLSPFFFFYYHISLSLSLCLSLPASLPVYLFRFLLPISLTLSPLFSLSLSLPTFLSVCLSVGLLACLSLSVCLPVSVSLFLLPSLLFSFSTTISLSLSLFLSPVSLLFSISFSTTQFLSPPPFSLSLPAYLSVCLHACWPVCLSLSLFSFHLPLKKDLTIKTCKGFLPERNVHLKHSTLKLCSMFLSYHAFSKLNFSVFKQNSSLKITY